MALTTLEKSFFFLLHGHNSPFLNQLMLFFSGYLPWLPLAGWLLYRVWRKYAQRHFFLIGILTVLLLAVVDTSTSYFFKNFIQRLRPCKMNELKGSIAQFGQGCGGKWGFFSSHAANAAALVHFLLAFARPSRTLRVCAWAVVILVGYSRIYLGVHLPLDVIVGWCWGWLVASAWRGLGRAATMVPASL